ncbi:ATP-binding cassette domain-containing protein [Aerococcus agrisoli]|uniref:ATP-binding cassette domain-containing protein n=1 Tax=Aerococcus agrisoli TaxID=2487350 RepID=A0A3N4H102_9LACT|nr:ABC transporter transmembrane domain-containing protein [Aerococcus agrisoli]RPA65021.1 ATP-binding cassette domain-containing protein [Aerococcus agrisoli]
MFSIFKKLGWFFKLRWKSYAFGVVALIICAILSAITPKIVGNMVDQIANGNLTWQLLVTQTGLILFFALLMYALRYGWRTAIFGNSTLLESIMRNRLFSHFTKMDASFYHKYRTGDLMAHATNDLAALRFVAGGGILTLTDSISISIVTLFSMVVLIDWKLTVLTILPFPLLIIAARILGKIINVRFRRSLEAFSSMNDEVQENVAGMKVIKTFGEEEDYYQDFVKRTDDVVEKNRQVYLADAAYSPVIEIITGLSFVLTIFFGTFFIQSGRITIGDLIAYISYLSMMVWPLLAVGRLVNTLERGNASWDRVKELLDETSAIVEADNPITEPIHGDIHFDIKSFGFPDDHQEKIHDVTFDLKEGNMLGVVGRTGSSKTTIFKLLLRDYDQYEGEILYDGKNIKEYSRLTLSSAFGYVPQTNFLFSNTIIENIRFGNPNLSDEEVYEYAKLADIHDDIMAFPEGYQTEVGERGVSLSGGQKQRLAIARALAVDPEYLILDDSLSAVDAQTEENILNNLREARANKTTIVAAQRLSSVMNAEEIIVMDEGTIVERGRHNDLVAMDGWYAHTYNQQQLQRKLTEEDDEDGNE